jgi:thiol-disulfide isomerase/thioredoxin
MLKLIFSILLFTSCNTDLKFKPIENENLKTSNRKKSVFIIGSGFDLNNEGTINLRIFTDCFLLDPTYIKLSEKKKSFRVDLEENCNQVEVALSSLIGHNDRHILKDGDTLQISLQKDGIIVRQSNKLYWESNFFYEVNKSEIGSNLFYTKFIFQNKGKKPKSTDLTKQTAKEHQLIDSLLNSNLITIESSIDLKRQVDLNMLLGIMRMQDFEEYEKMNSIKEELKKRDTEVIKSSLCKNWILKELLSYRMNLQEEDWDKGLDISVVDTINKYYNGIFYDFLKTHVVVNLYTEKLNQERINSIIININSDEYKNYLKEWNINDTRRHSFGSSDLMNSKGDVVRMTDILDINGITFIDFWASWCAPCREEMPYSKVLQKNFSGQPIRFVYISIDEKLHAWQKANESEGLSGYSHSYLLAHPKEAEIIKQLNITTIPRYIILNAEGKIINKNAPAPSDSTLIALLERYIELHKK